MIKHCVYPTLWGISLIRALLKPGKPSDQTSVYELLDLFALLLAGSDKSSTKDYDGLGMLGGSILDSDRAADVWKLALHYWR